MHQNVWSSQVATIPVAIAIGIFICFWGYKILKLTLGIMGFAAGAAAGVAAAMTLAPGHNVIALVCAAIGGILGAVLCVWLFFFGVFLLGATAAPAVAAAVLGGTGHQIQPLPLLICAVVLGILALVMQKLMIIISTSLAGSYLIIASILHLLGRTDFAMPFRHLDSGSIGMVNYVALAVWLLLALIGISFQYGRTRSPKEVERQTNVVKNEA